MLRKDVECSSPDENLHDMKYLWECESACNEISDECKYFIFGKGEKYGGCFWEKTENAECPEGWEDDQYDFYEMIGTLTR